jgi:hypothetical protein
MRRVWLNFEVILALSLKQPVIWDLKRLGDVIYLQ